MLATPALNMMAGISALAHARQRMAVYASGVDDLRVYESMSRAGSCLTGPSGYGSCSGELLANLAKQTC